MNKKLITNVCNIFIYCTSRNIHWTKLLCFLWFWTKSFPTKDDHLSINVTIQTSWLTYCEIVPTKYFVGLKLQKFSPAIFPILQYIISNTSMVWYYQVFIEGGHNGEAFYITPFKICKTLPHLCYAYNKVTWCTASMLIKHSASSCPLLASWLYICFQQLKHPFCYSRHYYL